MRKIDYNKIYCDMRLACDQRAKTADEWSSRAARMNKRETGGNSYTRCFLDAVDTTDCKSVFDVGCGTGNLLLPLAQKLEKACGLDFSAEMLRLVEENAASAGITNCQLFHRAWGDDWSDLPHADIVIASRCMDVPDMAEGLLKLHAQANKRIYLTYRVGRSFLDDAIILAVGRTIIPRPDYMLVVNILRQLGMKPSLNYINTPAKDSEYPSFELFRKRVEWSLDELSQDEAARLEKFYMKLPEGRNHSRIHNHPVEWALISWEK